MAASTATFPEPLASPSLTPSCPHTTNEEGGPGEASEAQEAASWRPSGCRPCPARPCLLLGLSGQRGTLRGLTGLENRGYGARHC